MIDSRPDPVPRAILTGGCWPTPLQIHLLRASLLDGEKALKSWEQWKSEEDFENLEAGSFRLLGLLYRNLLRVGADTSDPLVPRLKGIYLHFWTRNQMILRRKGPLLRELAGRGIPFLFLKGAALTLSVYRDYGVRPMEDFDLVVPRDRVGEAMDVLENLGWVPEVLAFRDLPMSIHACSFRNSEGACIDLHWRLCHLPGSPAFERAVWEKAEKLEFEGLEVSIPSLTDQFLHTCAHGPQFKAMSPVRWLADAFFLYRHAGGNLDWKRVFSNAPALGAVSGVRGTLAFLGDHLEVKIPAQVMADVRKIRVPLQERWENRVLSRPAPTPWHRMPVDFSHHLRCSRGQPWRRRLSGFKIYFRHANNLAPGQFTTHYKAQAIRSCRQWLGRWKHRLKAFPRSLFTGSDGSIVLWPERDLSGFHLLETCGNRALRWSAPHAGIRIRLPRGFKSRIELDLGSLRTWKGDLSGHLRFAFNGREIECSSIKSKKGVLHIKLPKFEHPIPGATLSFTWVCQPLASEGDSRALGLPVFAIRIIKVRPGKSTRSKAG
jgi:hypothetical protein